MRIALHSLQVIIDDYTFAHTSGRRQQPFASAGDCFSSTSRCARGAFSINFESTKFRIRPKTRWDKTGTNATQHIYDVSKKWFVLLKSPCTWHFPNCTAIRIPFYRIFSLRRHIRKSPQHVVDIVVDAFHQPILVYIWKLYEAAKKRTEN